MKKLTKRLAVISLSTIILGAVLTGAGLAAGAYSDLVAVTKPEKIEQTFDTVSHLNFIDFNQTVVIEPSKDDKIHVVYYQTKHLQQKDLTIDHSQESLTLTQENPNQTFSIQSPIRLVGEVINGSENYDQNTVFVQVPTKTPLKSITSNLDSYSFKGISILNLTVEKIDLKGRFFLQNSKVLEGAVDFSLNSGIDNSQISNMTFNNFDYLSITNSQVTNVTFKDQVADGSLSVHASQLSKITADIQIGNTTTFSDSSLADSDLTFNDSHFSAFNLSLSGKVNLTSKAGSLDLTLDKPSPDKLALKLTNSQLPEEEVIDYNSYETMPAAFVTDIASHYGAKLETSTVNGLQEDRASLTVKNPEASLTITGKGSTVTLN